MNFAKVDGAGYFKIKNGYLKVVGTLASIPLNWIKKGGDIDGEAADDDESGTSVSLSGDGKTVAIGAMRHGTHDIGHVRVYKYNESDYTWTNKGGDLDVEEDVDESGYSVSLSNDGHTVAIGAIRNNGNGENSGHVRVYKYDEKDGWTQKGSDIDGEAAFDQSGYSVSLSNGGKTVAIGAIQNADNGENSGHVRVYEYINNTWTQKGGDIDGGGFFAQSGYSVSLSTDGKTVAIGAIFSLNDDGEYSGHVRVYEYINNIWTQKGSDIDGKASLDQSGFSVSLSGDSETVAIGAPNNGNLRGHVRVYKYENDWTQKGSDIDGEANGDYSGSSVSLSNDGNTVAIGARQNDGNGENSGHVRVYKYDNDNKTWTQKGIDIDGEAAEDQSGYSVSLSDNGDTVAIGARYNDIFDDNGTVQNIGHVRVYEFK